MELKLNKLSASEVLYKFCGWLAIKNKVVMIGYAHDFSTIEKLIEEFIEEFNLNKPKEGMGSGSLTSFINKL